jgi:hypothetical protein
MRTNEELLKKDLAIIISLAVNILLKDELNQDDIVTAETLERALQVKKLLTTIDNLSNYELPF